jgi:hypothetical protein
MWRVKAVFNEIMASGYDPHKEALDVILVPDLEDGIATHSVRFIQGFTRVTCAITILTCAIQVLHADPGLAQKSESVSTILESCVNHLCNFRAVNKADEYYEMLRLPGMFPCCLNSLGG